MLPPVRVHRTELTACIGRIRQRHLAARCCEHDRLSDSTRTDPRVTLSYLRKHPSSQAPGWIKRADATDALLLVIASSWDLWRTERHHMQAGLSDGLFYDQMAHALGLGRTSVARANDDPRPSRRRRTGGGDPHQPARARLATLTDLLRYDEPDHPLDRHLHHAEPSQPTDPRPTWLKAHRADLATVVDDLLRAVDRYEIPGRRRLNELTGLQLADDVPPPVVIVELGLAVAELRTARPVAELERADDVHRALAAADQLRCSYSGIGCHAHWRSAPPPADIPQLVSDIGRRRDRLGDQRREHLPAAEDAGPAHALAFLRRYPSTNRATRQHDHLAALALVNAQWWLDRANELWAFRSGLRVGVHRTQLGSQFSIRTRQGVQDRVDRLATLIARGIPDEKYAREVRRPVPAPVYEERDWVAANQGTLRRLATNLLAFAATLDLDDDDSEWLAILASDHSAGSSYTATSLVTLALAAQEVHEALGNAPSKRTREINEVLADLDEVPTVKRLRTTVGP